jgi:hypothetical protein
MTIAFEVEEWLCKQPNLPGNVKIFQVFLDGIDLENGANGFWISMIQWFNSADPEQFPDANTLMSSSFQKLFNKELYPDPSILIIDEASNLFQINHLNDTNYINIIDEFIGVLQNIKQNCSTYSVYAIVLVGTETVRDVLITRPLPNKKLIISPFTAEASFKPDHFT